MLLAGCATLKDPDAAQEYSGDVVARLKPGAVIGQSFVSHRPGLNGIQLWLRQAVAPDDGAMIRVDLYRTPHDTTPLATSAVPFSNLTNAFPITIPFPARDDPPEQSYYLTLTVESGEADIFGRSENAYPFGALYDTGLQQDADIAFRTSYRYGATGLAEDTGRALRGLGLGLPLLLILWAPGRLVIWRFARRRELDWGTRTALEIGMSLALLPLVMLWTTTLGLRWGRVGVILVLGAVGVGAVLLSARSLRRAEINLRSLHLPSGHDLALAAVLAFTLALRLIMARDLAMPPWIDPVHHATITRLILESGGFPSSYLPYVQVEVAGYHPGFHAALAAFIWLSGMQVADAMLLFGQVLNALCSLAVYLMAVALTRSRTTGILAALASGVFSPMPAYYLSWGRYTQLAGLVILPTAVYLVQAMLKEPKISRCGVGLLAAVACGGLFLTHYRVAAFLALWLAAFFIAETIRTLHRRAIWVSAPEMVLRMAAVAAAAVVLTLPWWPGLFQSLLAPALEVSGTKAPQPLQIDWGYLTPVYGRQLLWLAGGGLLLSILRRGWFGPTLALWTAFLFMSANLGTLSLPLAGNVNKTSVEIMLFLPISVLAGYVLSVPLEALNRWLPLRLRTVWQLGVAGMLALAAGYGAQRGLGLLNSGTVLARRADRPALSWMAHNLPQGEAVLINPFLWGYKMFAGQDGGYWVTPAAGLKSLPPVALYGLGEREAARAINQTAQAVLDSGNNPQALAEQMRLSSVRYVFVGGRGGVISPRALAQSDLFRVLYQADGVWIFEITEP